jgi:putative FmdB family regulatory protein
MPTYEYECDACGHRFEKLQPMSASAVEKCPECSGKVRRLISGGIAAIIRNPAAGCSASCGLSQARRGREEVCEECPGHRG